MPVTVNYNGNIYDVSGCTGTRYLLSDRQEIIGRSAVANEYSGILSDYHAENSHAEFSKM